MGKGIRDRSSAWAKGQRRRDRQGQEHGGKNRLSRSAPSGNLPMNDTELPLLEHIAELRQRLLRSILAIILGAGAGLIITQPVLRRLVHPLKGGEVICPQPDGVTRSSISRSTCCSASSSLLPYILYQLLRPSLEAGAEAQREAAFRHRHTRRDRSHSCWGHTSAFRSSFLVSNAQILMGYPCTSNRKDPRLRRHDEYNTWIRPVYG